MATTLLKCAGCTYIADSASDAARHSSAFGGTLHQVASVTYGDTYAARLLEFKIHGPRGDYSLADPR